MSVNRKSLFPINTRTKTTLPPSYALGKVSLLAFTNCFFPLVHKGNLLERKFTTQRESFASKKFNRKFHFIFLSIVSLSEQLFFETYVTWLRFIKTLKFCSLKRADRMQSLSWWQTIVLDLPSYANWVTPINSQLLMLRARDRISLFALSIIN